MATSSNFAVTCIKDGFYDSGLLVESNDEKILNLNGCKVTTDNSQRWHIELFFKLIQATSANQDVYGLQRERGQDTNVDRSLHLRAHSHC